MKNKIIKNFRLSDNCLNCINILKTWGKPACKLDKALVVSVESVCDKYKTKEKKHESNDDGNVSDDD